MKNEKYNTYHILKDKKKRKTDNGQCRITIPRAIADSMELKDGDYIEFYDHKPGEKIIKKVDKDELE